MIVSMKEIAVRLDVKRGSVAKWRTRGIFPEPDYALGVGPVWKWSTVSSWALSTDRLSGVYETRSDFELASAEDLETWRADHFGILTAAEASQLRRIVERIRKAAFRHRADGT